MNPDLIDAVRRGDEIDLEQTLEKNWTKSLTLEFEARVSVDNSMAHHSAIRSVASAMADGKTKTFTAFLNSSCCSSSPR